MIVHLTGVSDRLSLGMKRYALDLAQALESLGIQVTKRRSGQSVTHCVAPVFFPRGKPFVVTCHDLAPISKYNERDVDYRALKVRLYRKYFEKVVDRSFNHADAIIAVSTQTAKEISDFFPEHKKKVRMVNPMIDQKFKETRREPHEGLRIGYYREYTQRIRRVVELVKSRGATVEVDSLTGKSEDKLVEFYNSLDYFLDFVSYRGFGYPMVEARACGTSVITMKDSRFTEEVKRLTLQAESEEDAASMIVSRMTQPCQEIPFTMARMASETVAVYREVLR